MHEREHVYWNLTPKVSPEPVIGTVNDTVIRITIPYLSADTLNVACWINDSYQQVKDKIDIISGYPPETPENISCVYFHKRNVTCSWVYGKKPKIPTNFWLTVTNDTRKKCFTNSTNHCSFLIDTEPFRQEYYVRMVMENPLGNATREYTVKTAKIVKMDPPEIQSLTPLPTEDPSFLISWRRPTLAPDELDVKCSLRYRQLQDDQWDFTPDLYMEKEKEKNYTLSGLHAYTEYVVSLRCIGSSGQLWWSEWSGECTERTAEKAPAHTVELWRTLSTTARTRPVHLRWKERSSLRPGGITLGYNVQWFPEGKTFDLKNKTTTSHETTIMISEEAHIISVASFNSAGSSPQATLRIPATWEKAREVISSLTVSAAENEGTNVSWTVTDLHFQRFVLEWCIYLGDGLFNMSFQYVENSSKWTIEKGILKPYNRYQISVYPILLDRVAAPNTTYFYIKEGAPRSGPKTRVENRKKTEATIRWDPLKVEETNGFITAFSIVYKPLNGTESVVTVNSDIYEYSLRSLKPNTLYMAYVVASTSAGNATGDHIQFHTLADSKEYIGALVGTLGTVLLLLSALGIAYKYKKEKVKNLLWPNVPDPSNSSISEWEPDWLQGVQFLNPVLTDGPLHSADLRILHAVYMNDKRDREFLLANFWEDMEAEATSDHSSILIHYAATETCPEFAACMPPLQSAPGPAAMSHDSQAAAHGGDPAEEEMPQDSELLWCTDSAVVNPYLKNSVRTREALDFRKSAKK
ncbi:hypothetical protein PRIEUP_LOCUS1497 [Pristimantis euphronides]